MTRPAYDFCASSTSRPESGCSSNRECLGTSSTGFICWGSPPSAISSAPSRRPSILSSVAGDVVFTVFTDSTDLYKSRLKELRRERGRYLETNAIYDRARYLEGPGTDDLQELRLLRSKASSQSEVLHLGGTAREKTSQELQRLWDPAFWEKTFSQAPQYDRQIRHFNHRSGLI